MIALIALVRKDLILYVSDKRALMMHLLMPVVLAAFFGSLFGGETKTSKIHVGLVMQDQGEIGRKIGAGLKADSSLNVTEMSEAEAQAQVRKGKLPIAIVIPEGFGERAGDALFGGGDKPSIPLFYDPSQSVMLAMVKGLLTQQVMQAGTSALASGQGNNKLINRQLEKAQAEAGQDPKMAELSTFLSSLKKFQDQRAAKAAAEAEQAKAAGDPAPAVKEGKGLSVPFSTDDQPLSSGPHYNGYAHSFGGMGVQFILFMGVDLGIGILLARRTGIWNRLLAAPVSLNGILMARVASGAIIALGLMCALFACAVLIFKVQIASVAGFLGVTLCFALMTAGFGLLIAAFGKTPEAARGIAVFATMIMVMLGGAWVPSFIFPEWMQTLTLAVPTRWAVDGFDAVTWRGLGLDAAVKPMAVQLAFALGFGGLAIWKFGRDQKR